MGKDIIKFSVKTLGCKLNQYESSEISSRLSAMGLTSVPFGEKADFVIVNTCAVTDNSEKKCRNYIRQSVSSSLNGATIVTGCLAEKEPQQLLAIPGVLDVFGKTGMDSIPEKIFERISGINKKTVSAKSFSVKLPARTRSYLKIQDGCDGECTYCIVPSLRGKPASRDINDVMEEAKLIADSGSPEIVLTGVTIGRYSSRGNDLAGLVEKIISISGDFRVRITSIEPKHVTDRLIELFHDRRICPHIHLPLQSGSGKILEEMKRPYQPEEFLEIVKKIKSVNSLISVGTDIIIGFPGESDKDFEASMETARLADFSYVHQFTFSSRSGTAASDIKNTMPAHILEERSSAMRRLSLELSANYRRRFIGEELECVIERKKGSFSGMSGNYLRINIGNQDDARLHSGKIMNVRLESIEENMNFGTMLKEIGRG